jgi:hypothetical protein
MTSLGAWHGFIGLLRGRQQIMECKMPVFGLFSLRKLRDIDLRV